MCIISIIRYILFYFLYALSWSRVPRNIEKQCTTENSSSTRLPNLDTQNVHLQQYLLILHFKFHQIFNISVFLFQINLSFEKKYLFPKMPQNHPKIYTKPPNSGWWNKQRDLALLETCRIERATSVYARLLASGILIEWPLLHHGMPVALWWSLPE